MTAIDELIETLCHLSSVVGDAACKTGDKDEILDIIDELQAKAGDAAVALRIAHDAAEKWGGRAANAEALLAELREAVSPNDATENSKHFVEIAERCRKAVEEWEAQEALRPVAGYIVRYEDGSFAPFAFTLDEVEETNEAYDGVVTAIPVYTLDAAINALASGASSTDPRGSR